MTFPYTGWVLMPSFKPAELTFVEQDHYYRSRHKSQSGKVYSTHTIYRDKHGAIAAGHVELLKQQAAVDKKQTNIHKRRAALEKAAGEAKP